MRFFIYAPGADPSDPMCNISLCCQPISILLRLLYRNLHLDGVPGTIYTNGLLAQLICRYLIMPTAFWSSITMLAMQPLLTSLIKWYVIRLQPPWFDNPIYTEFFRKITSYAVILWLICCIKKIGCNAETGMSYQIPRKPSMPYSGIDSRGYLISFASLAKEKRLTIKRAASPKIHYQLESLHVSQYGCNSSASWRIQLPYYKCCRQRQQCQSAAWIRLLWLKQKQLILEEPRQSPRPKSAQIFYIWNRRDQVSFKSDCCQI